MTGVPMANVAPKGRKHLAAEALFRLVDTGFDPIPDYRPPEADMALTDPPAFSALVNQAKAALEKTAA